MLGRLSGGPASVATSVLGPYDVAVHDGKLFCNGRGEADSAARQPIVARVEIGRDGQAIRLVLNRTIQLDGPSYCLHPLVITAALQARALLAAQSPAPFDAGSVAHVARVAIHIPGAVTDSLIVRATPSTPGVDLIFLDGNAGVIAELAGVMAQSRDARDDRQISQAQLLALAEDALGRRHEPLDNLIAAGSNSLDLVRLLTAVHESYHVLVSIAVFLEEPTLQRLYVLIVNATPTSLSSPAQHLETIIAREPASNDQPQPLTAIQRALWLASCKPRAEHTYVEGVAWRLVGELDVAALRKAWLAIVQLHESCRSCIVEQAGRFVQLVLQPGSSQFSYQQLSDAQVHAPTEHVVDDWLRQETRKPFVAGEPLARASVLRLASREHVLLFTAHHAMCDGTSLQKRLLSDLAHGYRNGVQDDAPAGRLQPRHLAQWEAEMSTTPELEQVVDRWRSEFADITEIDLPGERPSAAAPSYSGRRHAFRLSAALSRRLRNLAQREQQSMFVVMLASFRALLYRWCEAREVSIGTPIGLTWSRRFDLAAGCSINFVPIRTRVDGRTCLHELFRAVQEQVAAALERQHVPFQLVAERLASDDRSPLADLTRIGFAYRETAPRLQLAALDAVPIDWERGDCKADLILQVEAAGDEFRVSFDCSAERFEPEMIAKLAERYARLLEHLDQSPAMQLRDLPWLDEDERRQLVEYACGPSLPGAIHSLHVFANAARNDPNCVATTDGTREITFAELELRANAVAERLRALNIQRGELVPIYLETGVDWPVAIIGTWKAGAAFVSLDPQQPYARNRGMLEAARARVVITRSARCAELWTLGLGLIAVDELQPTSHVPSVELSLDDLAYGVFTSGSTGAPKLALADHRGIANKVLAQLRTFRIEPGTRVLQFASPAFDAALSEVVLALASGSTLVVAPASARYDGSALAETLYQQRIQVAMLTPSVVAALPHRPLPDLCLLLLVGEACPAELVQRWAGERRLFNLYGPSETSVWATSQLCEPNGTPPTIGRPIPNVRVYILDADLNLVPVGQAGEICIGGAAVGPGYFAAPDMTEERFAPDPHDQAQGTRLYRSGDRGLRLADGRIAFLGRRDDQVKMHGRRIELGEIEAALCALPGVNSAVVIVQGSDAAHARLVAFVRAEHPAVLDAHQLRDRLRLRLPSFMLPSCVTVLLRWPYLPSGKIDRRELAIRPTPDVERRGPPDRPRSTTEHLVVGAMARVLRLAESSISRHDDFIALGGHSLLVIALASELAACTGVDVQLVDLLDSPSIIKLATLIDQAAQSECSAPYSIHDDAKLSVQVRPGAKQARPWHTILLTGATGLFGSHVLAELLRRTNANVICPTRGTTAEDAQRRVLATLERVAPQLVGVGDRVRAMPADLERRRLGLSAANYDQLSLDIDAIFHVAARVNFVLPYAALRQANVEATRALIELACRGCAKPLHYVSSLSAMFPSQEGFVPALMEVPGPEPSVLSMGYGQSKAVSERLLLTAAERGLPVRIYRPSRICPSANTAPRRWDDLLGRFLRACMRLGRFPDTDALDNLIPVDVTAKLLLDIAERTALPHHVFHLANAQGTPISAFAEALKASGHSLELVRPEQWYQDLASRDLVLQTVFRNTTILERGLPSIDMRNTLAAVDRPDCPVIDADWLTRQLLGWLDAR